MENPAGTGFVAYKTKETISGLKLPNLENKKNEIKNWNDKVKPAGYGFIGPHWMPRNDRIGENIENPDKSFFNAAAPDLMTKEFLTGTEPVILTNLHPESGRIKFNLPGIKITKAYIYERQTFRVDSSLDTLVIEPDENLFTMVYRSKINKNEELK